MRRWIRDQSGATSIEYGLIASLIFLVVVGSLTQLGQGTNSLYGKVGTAYNRYIGPAE